MQTLAFDRRERADARPRTLIAAQHAVWIWPGVELTARRGEEVIVPSGEVTRFWITRWHGPEALYSDAVPLVAEAARRLTYGDETAAQRALDAIGLDRLSPDGAALMHRVAGRLGLETPDLRLHQGPRAWGRDEIDLNVRLVAQSFDCRAPLAKFIPFDSLKHPRWLAGAPESQGGEFRQKDQSDAAVIPVAARGGGNDKPPKRPARPSGSKPKKPRLVPGVRFADPTDPEFAEPRPSRATSPRPAPPARSDAPRPKLLDADDLRPGIGHNSKEFDILPDFPLELPPEIPDGPVGARVRNFFAKAAVKWITRALIIGTIPELGPYLLGLQLGIWAAAQIWPYIRASFQAPKTLEELQKDALNPETGYDIHHLVEKAQARRAGMPESVWNSPENRVRVPTLKHWQITGWYMTKNEEYGDLSPRDYLEGKSWEEKMEVGRKALIKFGVLKP